MTIEDLEDSLNYLRQIVSVIESYKWDFDPTNEDLEESISCLYRSIEMLESYLEQLATRIREEEETLD